MTFAEDQLDTVDTSESDKGMTGVSLPVFMLTLLGTLITVLGLFAAGEIWLVIVGLASVAAAGLIHVFSDRGLRDQ
jgi:hypothetical protein